MSTHKPGSLGALIGKRVYQYSTRASTTPSSSNDYTYTYDAVGNVQVVYKASGTVGQEAYFFAQDAFGNELSGDTTTPASNRTNLLGGTSWTTARTAGITEHQTGKIQSAFTGLVYFGARWYDPVVGRYISGTDLPPEMESKYLLCESNPANLVDFDGLMWGLPGWWGEVEFPGPGGRSNTHWYSSQPWWSFDNWGDPLGFSGRGAPGNPYARGAYYGACGCAAAALGLGLSEFCASISDNFVAIGRADSWDEFLEGHRIAFRFKNLWNGRACHLDYDEIVQGSKIYKWHINPPWLDEKGKSIHYIIWRPFSNILDWIFRTRHDWLKWFFGLWK